jgi:hypothetical protein
MLWTRVNKSGGCWIIGGSPTSDGYGRVVSQSAGKRKPWRAHVLAWTLASGVEPSDDQPVCHTCDTPRCVRNDEPGVYVVNGVVYPRFGHLFLGTPGANALDRNSKGRAPRGSALTMAKLTEDDVREIRRRYASGHVTQRALGLAYGVSKAAIFYIIQRKTWAHIDWAGVSIVDHQRLLMARHAVSATSAAPTRQAATIASRSRRTSGCRPGFMMQAAVCYN